MLQSEILLTRDFLRGDLPKLLLLPFRVVGQRQQFLSLFIRKLLQLSSLELRVLLIVLEESLFVVLELFLVNFCYVLEQVGERV